MLQERRCYAFALLSLCFSLLGSLSVRAQLEEKYDVFGGGSWITVHLEQLGPHDWCYPLAEARVISPYGGRGGRPHTGTDLKTVPGDSIRAAFDGVVTFAGPFAAYGNCVIVRHSLGLTTLYSHNVRNLVTAGQVVRAGEVLALTGRTGRATTEHLHFEVRVGGRPYSAALLFDHDTHRLLARPITFYRHGKVEFFKEKK